jgi:pectinesterase
MKKLFIAWIVFLTGIVSASAQYQYKFTVAKDGSGDYSYIQDAIDAMRVYPTAPITLFIKNGVYNEKIELPATKTDVTFIGESVDKTIITFNDYSGRGKLHTFNSFTAKIAGNRFRAENITFVNSAGPVGQAVALHVESDKAVFKNCRFIGHQDTIFTGGEYARQYFVDCYIEGTTDFIFGPATAVFQNCTIRSKSNSYITAASTTEGKEFGYVFMDCKLIADSAVTQVYLGRPWRKHAKTVFIRCQLGSHIRKEGWHNWNAPENEKTVFYAEYQNTGAGSAIDERAGWSKQLSGKEAKEFTLDKIFSWQALNHGSETGWYKR